MNEDFEWQVDLEDKDWAGSKSQLSQPRHPLRPIRFLLAAAMLVLALLGGWYASRHRLEVSEAELSQSVQTVLDVQHKAFLQGDGDLYFSMMANDAAWQAAQLQPVNLASARAGYTVTRAQARDNFVWANVMWEENGRSLQRITFFRQQNDRLVQIPTDPNYWGNVRTSKHVWGELVYHEVDEPFAGSIAAKVSRWVDAACAAQCVAGQIPFTLKLTTDFSRTAAPHTIHFPSPHLLALNENGQPAHFTQQQMQQTITDYLTPATIRFALPPYEVPGVHLLDYEQAAAAFMAANPHITVELVTLPSLPDNLAALAQFDGAAISPTAAMIAAGLVADLTDYAHSDPAFYPTDFYETVWQAAVWRDRLWFVPQTADLKLLYYDKDAYQLAERPEPSWQWNWAVMEDDMAAMIAAQPPRSVMDWGFLDVGRDSLFAYAYNESNRCQGANCPTALQPQQVEAALRWYVQMVQQSQMPDVSSLTPYEREEFLLSKQSARRHAAIWVDEPVLYENHLLLDGIGVAPFPGLDLFDGTTPLWVDGNFISAASERPYAVWQWLSFLSQTPPLTGFRRIPARPSIAAQTGFWSALPRQLADPMRAAFNSARPVTIEDKLLFLPEQVTAVTTGNLSPAAAANNQPQINWFANHQ